MTIISKYKPEYCAKVKEILATGKSLASVCANFGISRPTLYTWRDTHPEFADALSAGLQQCQAYWEQVGHDGITGQYERFAGSPWVYTMKNRFREDYSEDKQNKSVAESVVEKLIDKLVDK